MNNSLNEEHSQAVERVAIRINYVKAQLTEESNEPVLYSTVIRKLGLGDLLKSHYIYLWKEILASCINLEMQVLFSNLQKDLAKEEAPFSEIILDATLTHSTG